ncbi:MAG: hypothetical protein NZ874_04640 [Fimbriimonadales bacterium]|nr:hypothetical protein [Fimbriimonadales bacterium]
MKHTSVNDRRAIWTPLERRLATRMRAAPLGECLTFEEFLELARRGRHAKGYYQHITHLVSCPACRRAYIETRALLRLQRPSWVRWLSRVATPQLPQWAIASAVAASVFALALWTFYPKSEGTQIASNPTPLRRSEVAVKPETEPAPPAATQPPSQTTSSEVRPSTPRVRPADKAPTRPSGAKRKEPSNPSQGKVEQDSVENAPRQTQLAQGRPSDGSAGDTQKSSQPSSPETEQSPLERELASLAGRLGANAVDKLRQTFAALASGGARVRGSGSRAAHGSIAWEAPDLSESDLLEDTMPVFRWHAVESTEKYILALHRYGDETPLSEVELAPEQTEYRVPSALARGEQYEVRLRAVRGRLRTLQGTLRFTVMSEAQVANLRAARALKESHPITSALALYELKRYREALETLERAQQRHPNDEQIRRALDNLRAQMRQ